MMYHVPWWAAEWIARAAFADADNVPADLACAPSDDIEQQSDIGLSSTQLYYMNSLQQPMGLTGCKGMYFLSSLMCKKSILPWSLTVPTFVSSGRAQENLEMFDAEARDHTHVAFPEHLQSTPRSVL
jgi:hypothetical protein